MKRALILGAGFAGCSAAQRLHERGDWELLLLEAGPDLGGASRTQRRAGHSYTQGPQLFRASDSPAVAFLHSLLPMQRLAPGRLGSMLEPAQGSRASSAAAARACQRLAANWYEEAGRLLYPEYAQASVEQDPMDSGSAQPMAYPAQQGGYDAFFARCSQSATLLLGQGLERIDLESKCLWLDGAKLSFDVIINSAPLDDLFGQCLGPLRHMGMQHRTFVLPLEHALPEGVHCCYHAGEGPMARSVEHKKLNGERGACTLLGVELPVAGGRTHPLVFSAEVQLAERYAEALPDGVFSIGRLGRYRAALGPSDEVEQALEVCALLDSRLVA